VIDARPKTRGDCVDGPRPCPWVGCRHHLYLEVSEATGRIKVAFPGAKPWHLAESCSLDVADRGEHLLRDVGLVLNLTRERARQITDTALANLHPDAVRLTGAKGSP
jgi:hypothetical protein